MIQIPENEKLKIERILREKFGLTDEDVLQRVMNGILETGKIYSFGFGSLIKNPVDPNIFSQPAYLEGYSGDFNCAFRFYGGTHENPSLMFGVKKNPGGKIGGVVSEKNIFKDGEKPSGQGIIDYLNAFESRESPPGNSIYRFPFVEVETDKGEKILAFICETNPEGSQFVGDALTIDEKAIILANEWAPPYEPQKDPDNPLYGQEPNPANMRRPVTNYEYLIEVMDAHMQKEFEIEPELIELLQKANYYREQMSEDKRSFLDLMDTRLLRTGNAEYYDAVIASNDPSLSSQFRHFRQHGRKNEKLEPIKPLDERVFESHKGPNLSSEEYKNLLDSARAKLRAVLKMPEANSDKPMISHALQARGWEPILQSPMPD